MQLVLLRLSLTSWQAMDSDRYGNCLRRSNMILEQDVVDIGNLF
jgi:hypothetical protein